jgi:hypothetical protein
MTDRAAVVTTAIVQIVRGAMLAWLDGKTTKVVGARAAIEALLRDEFADIARTTFNEIRPPDE